MTDIEWGLLGGSNWKNFPPTIARYRGGAVHESDCKHEWPSGMQMDVYIFQVLLNLFFMACEIKFIKLSFLEGFYDFF